MTEIKKNKIWGTISTVDNIDRLRDYPFFFANSNHCLVISDVQPEGTIEMTEEFMQRFKEDDWAWIQSVISNVQQAQMKQYPEAAEELEKANEKFLKRFREELEAWRVRNGSGNEEQP